MRPCLRTYTWPVGYIFDGATFSTIQWFLVYRATNVLWTATLYRTILFTFLITIAPFASPPIVGHWTWGFLNRKRNGKSKIEKNLVFGSHFNLPLQDILCLLWWWNSKKDRAVDCILVLYLCNWLSSLDCNIRHVQMFDSDNRLHCVSA